MELELTLSSLHLHSSSSSNANAVEMMEPGVLNNLSTVIPDENLKNEIPLYLRITASSFFALIFVIGTVGNTMVAIIIGFSKDMRTSTNYFLFNLSVADLLVLIVCIPSAFLEVVVHPDVWLFGETMCKFTPMFELIVAHVSVLTILAISFERYYVICKPLNANSFCTKTRAMIICIGTWIIAAIVTSPMYFMTLFDDGKSTVPHTPPRCDLKFDESWPEIYTTSSIFCFFILPIIVLIITYTKIARRLTEDSEEFHSKNKNENLKSRKKVCFMLGCVVLIFFICYLPFRLLTLVMVFTDHDFFWSKVSLGAYYNINYISRILIYLNSSLNPILYNIMSSKFRNGFLRLCGRHRKASVFTRNGTFITNTTSTSITGASILPLTSVTSAAVGGGCGNNSSPELGGSVVRLNNGVKSLDKDSFEKYYSNGNGNNGSIRNGKNGIYNHHHHYQRKALNGHGHSKINCNPFQPKKSETIV